MRLLLASLALALALAPATVNAEEEGLATNFGGKADKHRGGKSPCLRPMRKVKRSDWGIAHRKWKCGTKVRVCLARTGACVIAPVIERGPYGAVLADDETPREDARCVPRKSGKVWCIKKNKDWPGTWRGVADLTFAVGAALGHNGKERVKITKVK